MRARGALLFCLALAVLHTWPLAGAPSSRSLNYNADAEQWEWTLSWIAHALPRQPFRVFDGNIFAPERGTLAYSDPVIAPALLVAPVAWLGGSPVLVFNVALIAGLTLTAWAAWFVAWRWTGSVGAALIAAALAAFNAHLLTRLPHVQAAHAWGIPLSVYFADRLLARPARRDVVLFALVVAATAATSLYTLAFAGFIAGAACLVALAFRSWRSFVACAGAFTLGLLLAAPILWPYARFAASGATRPLEMVAQFSATPMGYLTSMSRLHGGWTKPFFRDEVNVLFAGITALALAAIGLVVGLRRLDLRRRTVFLIVAAAIGVILSFGPATPIYRALYVALPPMHGLRAAARFGYIYLTVIALAAAMGLDAIVRRAPARLRAGAIAAALALVTIEAWSGPVPTLPFTGVPRIYATLADLPAPVLLAELPFYPAEAMFQNGDYMLNAAGHWRPVMNGYSGFIPDSYRRRSEAFWFFPRDWAIDAMKREGVTHVVVHLDKFTPDEVADIETTLRARTDFRLIGSDAVRRLYQIERPGRSNMTQ